MGAWGAAIFSNDIALDIRREYQALLAFGTPKDEAYQLIKEDYRPTLDDVNFWFTIATIQHKYGLLLPEVKENTLRLIDSGVDEYIWHDSGKRAAREKVRQKLKKDLLSPLRTESKVPKPRIEKARWSEGDIILSEITAKIGKAEWGYGKYVSDKVLWIETTELSLLKPGLACNSWPFAALYNWIGDEPPDLSVIESLDFFNESNWRDGNRVVPIGLSWIPKLEKLTLFKKGDTNYAPQKHEMIHSATGSNIFSVLNVASEHFKALYEKHKK